MAVNSGSHKNKNKNKNKNPQKSVMVNIFNVVQSFIISRPYLGLGILETNTAEEHYNPTGLEAVVLEGFLFFTFIILDVVLLCAGNGYSSSGFFYSTQRPCCVYQQFILFFFFFFFFIAVQYCMVRTGHNLLSYFAVEWIVSAFGYSE